MTHTIRCMYIADKVRGTKLGKFFISDYLNIKPKHDLSEEQMIVALENCDQKKIKKIYDSIRHVSIRR